MPQAKLTSKGQITLPKPVREYLRVGTGDMLEFILDEHGKVIVTAKTVDVRDLYGMVKSNKPVTIEDMKKSVKRRVSKRYRHK